MESEQLNHSLDQLVRYQIYDHVMCHGLPPTIAEISSALSRPTDEVRASFQRLSDGHILVLLKVNGEILMANPFSAVPTPFLVRTGRGSYYGNCIWDAMGIPAILKQDATIEASCGCCGASMNLKVTNGLLQKADGIAHFAIPAARWWDDIVLN